jgi:hypothetical protein
VFTAATCGTNAVLGQLTLDSDINGLFVFAPAGTQNALYVSYLSFLDSAQDFTSAMTINPGLTIYFQDSNLPVDQLNGAFGGRLVYVPPAGGGPVVTGGAGGAGRPTQGTPRIRATNGASPGTVLTWTAQPKMISQVEFTSDLRSPWKSIFSGYNPASISQPMQFNRSFAPGAGKGFYRVKQFPRN